MPAPLWADFELSAIAARLQSNLNVGYTLHLFSNAFLPNPSSLVSDFTECTFAGYSPISLSGAFATPTQVQSGQWQTAAPMFTFTCTGGSQQIAGWFITRGALTLAAAEAYTTPFVVSTGVEFQLTLRAEVLSQSILSPPGM